jgi:hypothetical protein
MGDGQCDVVKSEMHDRFRVSTFHTASPIRRQPFKDVFRRFEVLLTPADTVSKTSITLPHQPTPAHPLARLHQCLSQATISNFFFVDIYNLGF